MIVVQCDKCKTVTPGPMNAMELKIGTSDGHARDGVGIHYCDGCAKELGINEFVHKLLSAGGQRMMPPTKPADIAPPTTPVPVDPRFLKKIRS